MENPKARIQTQFLTRVSKKMMFTGHLIIHRKQFISHKTYYTSAGLWTPIVNEDLDSRLALLQSCFE